MLLKKTGISNPFISKLVESVSKLSEISIYRRFASGTLWSLFASVISQGLSLISTVPVARFLGVEVYGQLGIIQNTISLYLIIAGPSIGIAATKYIAENFRTGQYKTGKIISLTNFVGVLVSFIFSAFIFLFSKQIVVLINGRGLENELQIASLLLFLNGIFSVQNGVLSGFEAFKTIAIINIVRGIVYLPLIVIGSYWWGLRGTLVSLVIIALIVSIYSHICIKKLLNYYRIPRVTKGFFEYVSILTDYSFPAFLSSIVVMGSTWIANVILVNQTNGYIEMGIFNAANQWRFVVLFIPSIVSKPILPMLSETLIRDRNEFQKTIRINIYFSGFFSAFIGIVIALSAPIIMSSYGAEFQEKWFVLSVLCISAIFTAFGQVIGNILWSTGQMWISFLINFIWAVLFLGCIMLTPKDSLGLSTAYFISFGLHLIFSAFITRAYIFQKYHERI